MNVCDTLSHYIPVMHVSNESMVSDTNVAGIFVECLADGIGFKVSRCNVKRVKTNFVIRMCTL